MKYLTQQDLIDINTLIIKEFSPKEPIGISQPNSLDMTVNSLKQEVFGQELYPTIELKAANLYRNVVMKHIFINANKRTSLLVLYTFLSINGYEIDIPQQEAEDFTVRIATERLEEQEIAEWIKKYLK